MPGGWNDKVSSVKCTPSGYFTTNIAPLARCYVYEHNHSAGKTLIVKVDQNKSNLKNNGMNDKILSIRVGWGIKCEFYKDSDYRNKLFSMTGDTQKNDLSNEYNDKFSSITCYTYQP